MNRPLAIRFALALFCAALLLPAAQASARKVGNPGNFHAEVTDGLIRIKSQTFTFDDSDPNNTIEFDGSITSAGAVTIPESGVHFPDQSVSGYDVHINAADPITGTLNPLTGDVSLNLRVWIKIDGIPFGGDCRIASDSSPIVVNPLIEGTTNPPSPNGPITGVPYNPSTGQGRVVNNSYSVPESSSCGPGGGTVNDTLGIPSSAGNNEARFTLAFRNANGTPNPITKGVNASFTAAQGPATTPLNMNFDASASTRVCSPNACQYRWDFDNNGTTDQTTSGPTTSFAYSTPGTKTAKLTLVDTDGDTDFTTRTFTVNHAPDLAIDKSHVGNFLAGTNGTYTIGVSNLGPGATQGTTTVSDTLPSGLTFVSGTGTGWTCGAVGQTVTCARASLINPSTSAPSITLTVAAANSAPASVTNSASVSSPSTPAEVVTNNNSDPDPTTIDRIDLGITKTDNDVEFETGTVETYELEVTNHGSIATLGQATVTDALPPGISYQGFSAPAGWNCSAAGQNVTCTHAAGYQASRIDTIELQVVAGALAVPSVNNTANVTTQNDSNAANDEAQDNTSVRATVDLTVDKQDGDGSFRLGSADAYTIDVQNRGARSTAGTTTVTDTLPAGVVPTGATGSGWNCNIAGQDVTCTNSTVLAASESEGRITVDVEVDSSVARPTITNTANVATSGSGDDADSNPGNNSDAEQTTITVTDLTVEKTHTGAFPLGGTGRYTLSVRNDGTAATEGTTTVTDTLPAELTFSNASGTGWSCDAMGQVVTCTRTTPIAGGQTAPAITLNVDVADVEANSTTNNVSVATADDVNSANDSDSDVTQLTAADLTLTKTHSGDFRIGTTRAYVLRVSNVGSRPTEGDTTVTDTLPTGLTYVAGTGSGWSCGAVGQDVTCTRTAVLAGGASASPITIQVSVGPQAYPSVTNIATAENSEDRNTSNDSASDPTDIVGSDLTIDKTHLGSILANDRASYLIDVSNVGSAETIGTATVSDTLPAGLTYAGSPSGDWTCSNAGQQVSCEHEGSIAAGESAQTLELRVDVASSVGTQVTNTALVSAAEDPNGANNSDGDIAPVERIDAAIDKSHTGDLTRGDRGSYTIDVSNEGTVATQGTTRVTDTLPAGLNFDGASGTGWNCSSSANTVECLHPGSITAGGDAAPLTINVEVSPTATPTVTNTATVSAPKDANSANDSDSDPTNTVAPTGQDVSGTIRAQLPAGGTFRSGGSGAYLVVVRNTGPATLIGPVTAEIELPQGLNYARFSAPGWNCSLNAVELVECVHAGDLPVEARSDIEVEFNIDRRAVPSATSDLAVSTAGDPAGANNTDSETTPVQMINLGISMQHSGTFAVGGQSAFTLNVENVGTAGTVTPLRILDELPAGITFAGGSGMGWTCTSSGQVVSCTHNGLLAAGASAGVLTLNVIPQASAADQIVINQANVLTKDDGDPTNNAAVDGVRVGPYTPPTVTTPPATAPGGVQGAVAGTKCKKKKKRKKRSASAAAKCKKKKKRKK